MIRTICGSKLSIGRFGIILSVPSFNSVIGTGDVSLIIGQSLTVFLISPFE